MITRFISLLWPDEVSATAGMTKNLKEDAIVNLDLEGLCISIADEKEYIVDLKR